MAQWPSQWPIENVLQEVSSSLRWSNLALSFPFLHGSMGMKSLKKPKKKTPVFVVHGLPQKPGMFSKQKPGPTGSHHRHSRGFREAHRFGVEQGGSGLPGFQGTSIWIRGIKFWAILLANLTPEMNGNEFNDIMI